MTDRKLRVRVLQKGGGGRAGKTGEAERPGPALTIRPRTSSTVAGRFREISFRPADDLEVHVRFLPPACADLLSHCAQSNVHGHEICGLILGTATGPFREGQLHVYRLNATDVLPLETSDASGAHVSAAPEAWAQADEEIEARFQGKERLGWYHTHPTQGIFFSAPDKDFHSVFTRPFQFALVVDARSQDVGLFYWQDRVANRISSPIPLDLRPALPLSRQVALPAAGPEAPSTARGRHRPWLLAVGLFGFVGLLAMAGADAARLAPVAALFLAALLLRFWNSGTTLPPRAEEPDGSRLPEISAAGPLGLALLAFALGSMLLAFILGLRPDAPVPTQAAGSPEAQSPAPAQAPTGSVAVPSAGPAVPTAGSGPAAGASVEIWVRAETLSPRVLLAWATNGGSQRVEYLQQTDGSYGKGAGEDDLLRHLLDVKQQLSLTDIRRLQKALGVSPDGDWGPTGRGALIHAALGAGTLTIDSPGQRRTIVFRRAGG